MIGGNGSPFGKGPPPLIVTPAQAELDLNRGVGPNGQPAIFVTVKLTGYPVWLQVPVPVLAWAKLVAGVSSVEATD